MKRFVWSDAIVAVLLLLGGAASIPVMTSHAPPIAVIRRDNAVIGRYPLSTDADITVRGACGPMVIRINGGRIGMVSSRCPRHICQHTSPIGWRGQQIICVPNHVIIEIESPDPKGAVDAVIR